MTYSLVIFFCFPCLNCGSGLIFFLIIFLNVFYDIDASVVKITIIIFLFISTGYLGRFCSRIWPVCFQEGWPMWGLSFFIKYWVSVPTLFSECTVSIRNMSIIALVLLILYMSLSVEFGRCSGIMYLLKAVGSCSRILVVCGRSFFSYYGTFSWSIGPLYIFVSLSLLCVPLLFDFWGSWFTGKLRFAVNVSHVNMRLIFEMLSLIVSFLYVGAFCFKLGLLTNYLLVWEWCSVCSVLL